MPTTTPGGLPYPAGNATGNVPSDLAALANAVKNGLTLYYPTVSARNAAITVANGAYVGQIAWTDSPATHWKITAISGSTITWARLIPVVDDVNPNALAGNNWDGVSPLDRRHFPTSGTVQNSVGNTQFTFQKGGSNVPFANGVLAVTLTLGDLGVDTLVLAKSLITLSGCVGFAKNVNGSYPASGGSIGAVLTVTGW